MRIISPPFSQLNNLRQPLTRGEKIVFNFFNEYLPEEWEMYIQPHLNGLRPDFVLLNPRVGIAVYEVKDWDLNAMSYFSKEDDFGLLQLYGRKDGKEFSLTKSDPTTQVARYRKQIYELYCPRLEAQNGFAAITAGIIFPFAFQNDLQALFSSLMARYSDEKFAQYTPLVGREALESGDIKKVFPASKWSSSKIMRPELADDLRSWLVEPDFASLQRKPLVLDKNQKALAHSRTESGYRRIKGAAGSGKSLVLAARAANLMDQGKNVLIVSFNITLWHYLRDIVVRSSQVQGAMQNLTLTHFHLWCKNVCIDSGRESDYIGLFKKLEGMSGDEKSEKMKAILNQEIPSLVKQILNSDLKNELTTYDAVLVDEGQDFLPEWWNILRKIGNKNCEMLLVADATQDVYDTAKSWTDEAMTGAGFPGGRWAELNTSYRLPPTALTYARKFAEAFLPSTQVDLPEPEQSALDIYPCELKWVQCSRSDAIHNCKQEILSLMKKEGMAISDITFLCGTQKDGLKLVGLLGELKINVLHTFDVSQKETRRKKMGFYMGDARIKATTLHSFKGWESKALVIFIDDVIDNQSLALIYTGLTRLKRSTEGSLLTIVSSAQKLKSFGKTWPEYIDVSVDDATSPLEKLKFEYGQRKLPAGFIISKS